MKNKLIIMFGMILLTFVMLNFVSADVIFSQQRLLEGNGTIKDHIFVQYSTPVSINGSIQSNDYVSGGKPFEFYYLYDINVKTWNTASPSFNISDCQINIYSLKSGTNSSTLIYNANYTQQDDDIASAKYFLQLNNGDDSEADIICHYTNKSYDFTNGLYYSGDIQAVQPTWRCLSCQFYQWSVQEKQIVKAKIVGDNFTIVVGYITNLINLNYEIFLLLFWTALILSIFIGLSFLLYIFFYFIVFLKGLSR